MPARCVSCIAIAVLALTAVAACGAPSTAIPSTTPRAVIPTPTPTNTATAIPAPASTVTTIPTALPTPTPGMSAEARAYLDQALDLMEQHSINRAQVDWTRLRRAAHSKAADALTPADTYLAIEDALRSLGDGHSFFLPPDQVVALQRGAMNAANSDPSGRLLDDEIAYLLLPAFGGSTEMAKEYAATIQRLIRELDAAQPCGWVVDLRQNRGGAMWPMLAGIGPLLGEGQVGAFVTPDGEQTTWFYTGGRAGYGSSVQTEVESALVYPPLDPLPPVAVLTGRMTASSGEAIVVAFRGRTNTRSFGLETAGLTTANEEFSLSDGAWMLLTVSRFADRTGKVYSGPIVPDEVVNPPETWPDPVMEAASGWLLSQPACTDSDR